MNARLTLIKQSFYDAFNVPIGDDEADDLDSARNNDASVGGEAEVSTVTMNLGVAAQNEFNDNKDGLDPNPDGDKTQIPVGGGTISFNGG